MSKKSECNFEKQKQYQQSLQQIQKNCQIATKKIRQGLLEGMAIKMQNQEIMGIYNDIYKLTDQAGNAQAQKNQSKNLIVNNGEKVEEQLIMFFKDFLNEFITDIYQKVNEFQGEKESVRLQLLQNNLSDGINKIYKLIQQMISYNNFKKFNYQNNELIKKGFQVENQGCLLKIELLPMMLASDNKQNNSLGQ